MPHIPYTVKNEKVAQEVGISVASAAFNDMKNVSNQGTNFSWHTFGTRASSMASGKLFTYYSRKPRNLDYLKVIAEKSAAIEWAMLLDRALSEGITLPVLEVAEGDLAGAGWLTMMAAHDDYMMDISHELGTNDPFKTSLRFIQDNDASDFSERALSVYKDYLRRHFDESKSAYWFEAKREAFTSLLFKSYDVILSEVEAYARTGKGAEGGISK